MAVLLWAKHRSYLSGTALLFTCLGIASYASANLLLDPSFEPGIAGAPDASSGDVPMSVSGPWSGWNNWVPPYSAYYTQSIPAEDGVQVGKTFSGPNGGIYQFIAANAGDSYTASAYFVDSSSDPMQDGETDDVRMIFWSGPNGTGSSLATDVSAGVVSDLSPLDTWIPLSVTAPAPAGTESIQWMAFFNNPNYQGGSLFVDNGSLVDNSAPVPEPTTALLAVIAGIPLVMRRAARKGTDRSSGR